MESVRPFSERMAWSVTRSCGCQYDVLIIDRREEAFVMSRPAGWAVRMNRLSFHAPGGHAVYPTREEAMRHAEDWFRGLDVVPWD